MKRGSLKKTLAGVAALALVISCLLTGLVLPVAAEASYYASPTLQLPNVWIMTGRYRVMGNSTVQGYDSAGTAIKDGSVSVAASAMTWSIADTSIATIDTNGKITPVKVGQTTLTGTFPSTYLDKNGAALSKTIDLHVVDGSKYVYFDPDYELGANVVTNGDLELDLSNGWRLNKNPNNAATPLVTDYTATGGKDGTGGLQFKTGASYTTNLFSKSLVTAGNLYLLSFDYYAAPGNKFEIYGGNMNIPTTTFTIDSTATGTWKTYTYLFRMPVITAGSRYFYFTPKTVNADNPVVIDNVSICEYTSLEQVEALQINIPEKRLLIGQTQRLEATTIPYGGDLNNVTWASDNEDVATVATGNGAQPSNLPRTAYGTVTAVGPGTATITVTTPDGLIASCKVIVFDGFGKGLLLDPECDSANKKVWKAPATLNVQYATTGGKDGSSALKVTHNTPVSQSFTGLQPNTTYTLFGSVNLAANGYLVITVVNGDQVVTTLREQYNGTWDTAAGGEATQLRNGFEFTTPATLESDTTTIHVAVLKSADDTAATLVGSAASASSSGKIEQGDGEVTDDEEDLEAEALYVAYVDSLDIAEPKIEGVDLTPTYVQWIGDTDNDGQVTPGTQVTFQVPVKNAGTTDLPAGIPFDIEIAANREVISTITYDGGIAAGETVLITDTKAWTAVAGDYMISARVNANLSIVEPATTISQTNQTYQLNLRVANDTYTPAYNADIIAQAGMDRLTLSDDFNDLSSVDTLGGGQEGYKWYITRPWSGDPLTPYDYAVDNGVLTLMAEVPTYGIAFNSVDMATNNGYRYKQGYLEVRLRIVRPSPNASHEEGIPAVWSFTEDKAMESITGNDKNWVELDWLEYWGNTNQYPGGYYTTTFHQSTTVDTTPSYSNSNHSLEALGDAEWHVMGWLWEENSIRTFVDGVEMMNMLVDDEASLVPGPRINKEGLGSKSDPGLFSWINEEEAVLYLGGAKDNPHEIDYVRIWQTSEPETVSDNMTITKDGEECTELMVEELTREQLNIEVPAGEDAGTIKWESSDPTVATVHGNGVVYGRGAGSAVITATNGNGSSVMCTVKVSHNLIPNGKINDTDNDLLYKSWADLTTGVGSIVTDPADSTNKVLQITRNTSGVKYLNNWNVEKSTTYRLTGKYKGPSTMYAYFNSAYSVKSGNVAFTKTGTVNGWNTFTLEFTTKDATMNSNYVLGFRNTSTTPCYLDDLVLTKVDTAEKSAYTLTVGAMENGSVTLTANGSTISSGATLTPGTYVDVKVNPNSGYQLTHGSLIYSYALPTGKTTKAVERKVLNKNSSTFGADTAKTFRFVMPDRDTTLTAAFEATATATDSIVATLGTSVYVNDGSEVSGVRFLNRLYYSRMDADTGELYVNYNGAEKKVAQFGTLLKRSTNDGELTLAAYDEHKNDASATRIWKSEALRYGNLYLVDYTNDYVDFTITMTSSVANRYSFLDRGYTVCGYVVLEDGTTIYTEAFTDTVLNALTRSL